MRKFILIIILLTALAQPSWAAYSDNIVITSVYIYDHPQPDGNSTRHVAVSFANKTNSDTTIFVRYFQSKKVLGQQDFMDNLPSDWTDKWDLAVDGTTGGTYVQNVKSTTKTIIFDYRDSRDSEGKWYVVRVSENTMVDTQCPEDESFREVVSPKGPGKFKYGTSKIRVLDDGRIFFTLYVNNLINAPLELSTDLYTNGLNGEYVYGLKDDVKTIATRSKEPKVGSKIVSMVLPRVPKQERLVVTVFMKNDPAKWRRFIFCLPR